MNSYSNDKMNVNPKIMGFFSALSDETRLKIVIGLKEGKKSVTDIHKFVGEGKVTLSGISHQLNYLRNLDIVESTKQGKERIYSLSNNFCNSH